MALLVADLWNNSLSKLNWCERRAKQVVLQLWKFQSICSAHLLCQKGYSQLTGTFSIFFSPKLLYLLQFYVWFHTFAYTVYLKVWSQSGSLCELSRLRVIYIYGFWFSTMMFWMLVIALWLVMNRFPLCWSVHDRFLCKGNGIYLSHLISCWNKQLADSKHSELFNLYQ